ncbi:Imm1 family immunity protein [Lentzea sp. CA-135723]|uniref:Imm1 family immunity protein n=1 Tax=Lentzea sp. CA-135723 TaxID=3239950 RepID=UPI003D8E055F
MATLKAVYNHETGASPFLIATQEDLNELIIRVIELEGGPVPSIVELAINDDPYGFPHLYAGIGAESGFVQEYWDPARATLGDQAATGTTLFDFADNTQEIPVRQVVPLEIVRAVLAAYLEHGGRIPADFAELHFVDVN